MYGRQTARIRVVLKTACPAIVLKRSLVQNSTVLETIFFIDLVKTSSVETDIRQLFKNDLTLEPNKIFTIFLNVLKRYDAERDFNPLRTSLLFKYETAFSDRQSLFFPSLSTSDENHEYKVVGCFLR